MSPRVTVIGLHFAPEPTGNAPYTTSLARHLAETGWNVRVVTGFPHYPQWKIYSGFTGRRRRESAGRADVLRVRQHVPRKPHLLNRLLMELHFGLKASWADWGDPDVVLFVSPALFSTGIAALAARVRYRRARTVVWVQDLYGRGVEESHRAATLAAPMQAVERAVLSSADKVVVIHDRFRAYVCDRLRISDDKVEVIRNWSHIDPPQAVNRAEVRRELGWGPEDTIVLHAGNMGVKQHLENVVEAARLAQRQNSRIRFVLLGNGNQRRALEALGAGIDHLQFIDPLPDEQYSAALSAADILLVNEKPGVLDMSVPSKLTSYFVTGRPVLAAVEPRSATASELERSGAGAVVASGDPHALLQAAESLGADPEATARLGENGPRYATEHLTTEAAMRRWNHILRSLLTPGTRSFLYARP